MYEHIMAKKAVYCYVDLHMLEVENIATNTGIYPLVFGP